MQKLEVKKENSETTLNCEIEFLDGFKYKVKPTLDQQLILKKLNLNIKLSKIMKEQIKFSLNPEEETVENEYIFKINEQLKKDIEVEIIINGDGGGGKK